MLSSLTRQSTLFFPIILLLLSYSIPSYGFGSMGPISAAYGAPAAFFCAIDASGRQDVICWNKNGSTIGSSSENFTVIPPIAALSGGENFMCGILANTSQAYCFDSSGAGYADLVPSVFKFNSYSHIAAGKSHVCAIKGSYSSSADSGPVDCWEIIPGLKSQQTNLFYNDSISSLEFKSVVSGEGFSCGVVRDGGVVCWGPNSTLLGLPGLSASQKFESLTAGRTGICGISEDSKQAKCWAGNGNGNGSYANSPIGVKFVSITAGEHHCCGIREDNHGIECWGNLNSSAVPKGSAFFAIASLEFITCGIREEDLVLDCWFVDERKTAAVSDFDPPLQLCSPGLCSKQSCDLGEFAFNASTLNEPDLSSLCVRKDLKVCLPCGLNCSEGFFLSSPCTENSDRVCTACSLCQNSSCWDVCGLRKAQMEERRERQTRKLILILGPSISGCLLIAIGWCLFPYLFFFKSKEGPKRKFRSCIGKPVIESEDGLEAGSPPIQVQQCPGEAQIFRLSELKDATNGFKEFNELGRGSYGFVYKAVLTDGRQVAVKRANAATIIHTNIRDFETELEVLCKIRHCNIVNLLGYCLEMGERLLVYEYMPHGTLHDHLHGGLSPLNWTLRLRIAMQAAKGLEYLHKEADSPIVHGDVTTSNILLDSDWGGRVSDFGFSSANERDLDEEMRCDVYDFGVVLLEILSGRKAYDVDYSPPSIVEWAVPFIKKGKAAAIIDRYVALPRNVECLLRLADVAEAAVRENLNERPMMAEVALSLEQIVKEGLVL